jgi:hypothetical protein
MYFNPCDRLSALPANCGDYHGVSRVAAHLPGRPAGGCERRALTRERAAQLALVPDGSRRNDGRIQ